MSAQVKKSGVSLFYGWWIVLTAGLCMALGPGIMAFFTLGIFMQPLTEELGWSRTAISGGPAIGALTIAVLVPLFGNFVDRMGVRPVLLPAVVLFAVVLASLSFLSSSIWHFYAAFFLIGVSAAPAAVSYIRIISSWFDRRRGLALGLAMSGTGVGAAAVPLLAQFLIDGLGWRLAYLCLAAISLSVILPIVAFILKDHPSDLNLQADGFVDLPSEQASHAVRVEGVARWQAMKQRSFWQLAFSFFVIAAALNGLVVHFVPILADRGMSAVTAASLFSVVGLSIIVGRVACGIMVDRYFAPYVAAVIYLGTAFGIAGLAMDPTMVIAFVAAFLIGLGVGAETDLVAYLVTRYFGLRHFGEIFGYVFGAFMIGTSVGPLFMGYMFDTYGSYDGGLILIGIALLISCASFLFLGPFNFAQKAPDKK